MNDFSPNDPHLQDLEARVAAALPRTSTAEREQMLYQCAFAAGQAAVRKRLRRWQGATAVLTVLFAGLSVSFVRQPALPVNRMAAPPAPVLVAPDRTPTELERLLAARRPAAVALDAWQAPPSASESFAEELARFEQTDPRLRSLALGPLTRKLLEQ
ncbi:MAG TPA: hypothetical protein VHC19_20615 [Pirellulales bacterium]|nr:hypothetical protein [Pirellulales bacterium]